MDAIITSSSPSPGHSTPSSPSWVIDTGATSHITNDVHNLDNIHGYFGSEHVHTADGEGQCFWSDTPQRST
ncbi:non-specific serine/threonine protein kinase [Ranunculus cassubicifolius]